MPDEKIFSFLSNSADAPPTPRARYATTFPMAGFVQGLIVESHGAHPTKIEGHGPRGESATSLFAQASILDLYSPYRLKKITHRSGVEKSKADFEAELHRELTSRTGRLAILTAPLTSPTLAWQIARLPTRRFRHYIDDPIPIFRNSRNINFSGLHYILSFDFDFLGVESGGAQNPLAFAQARSDGRGPELDMLEPGVSLTGTKADRRWAVPARDFIALARALENEIRHDKPSSGDAKIQTWAERLRRHHGRCAVFAGYAQPPELHEIIDRINSLVAARDSHTSPIDLSPRAGSLEDLTSDLRSGAVNALVIFGGDPVRTAIPALGFADVMQKIEFVVHLTDAMNETSRAATWAVPQRHFLEDWSDAVSVDGRESLIQPLLSPMHESWSPHEMIEVLSGGSSLERRTSHDLIQSYWRQRMKAHVFDKFWRESLASGFCESAARPSSHKHSRPRPISKKASSHAPVSSESTTELEVIFRPDLKTWDGRFSENAWLRELPDPISQLSWDHALQISNDLAKSLSLSTGDWIRMRTRQGAIEAPVVVVDGISRQTICATLGSRPVDGDESVHFDVGALRDLSDPWRADVTSIEKIARHSELASTQTHHEMGPHQIVMDENEPSLANAKDFGSGARPEHVPASLYDEREQWAMSIDTDACIGCSICVIACQAENNIPVVGKKMVLMGREMHWIRVDRYRHGPDSDQPRQPIPVTCMHCEKAPCEVVCPVQATSHSSDGLNQMVYNRCVGTRYCSNNCPYKVRRFNFYDFAAREKTAPEQRNPEVTVRARGVMEKCTYCVQRIEAARIDARREDRDIRDGEVKTACQQACPTRAIEFGNLRDPKSAIHRARKSKRTYALLTELGTRPRTTYMALRPSRSTR